jgi:hypothetical protein
MSKKVTIVDSMFSDIDLSISWYERIYYKCYRGLSNVKYFLMKTRQTIRHGFPDWHAYEFKEWHSIAVVPRLKRLKSMGNSYPVDLKPEEWLEVLDKMIWSFENYDNTPAPVYSDDYDHRYERIETEHCVTFRPLNKTGTIDRSNIEAHMGKVQEGLDLFAKHYNDLWD